MAGRRYGYTGWRPFEQILVAVQSSREIGTVFTRAEADLCGYEHGIRIPQMTLPPTGVLALDGCGTRGAGGAGTLKDDMSQTKIVSKFSMNMGKTWGPSVPHNKVGTLTGRSCTIA